VLTDVALLSTLTTFRSDDHFILGSREGILTIAKLLAKNPGDAAFTNFTTRLSVALKNLNPTDAVVIDESYKVCNDPKFALTHRATHANYHPLLGWGIPIPQSVLRVDGRLEYAGRPFAL
jgi:hypothetical protein